MLISIEAETLVVCEGDEDNGRRRSEIGKTIAHGDRMGGTRQSMNVAVKDQHDSVAMMIFQPPRGPVDVLQFDDRSWRADYRSAQSSVHEFTRSIAS